MRSRSVWLAAGLLLGACITAPVPSAVPGASAGAPSSRVDSPTAVFAPDSPFNRPIPPQAVVDEASARMVARLSRKGRANAALYEFAIPIWDAQPDTPGAVVRCAMTPAWGPCPFAAPVPIPSGAHPHVGSDGAMVVVDAGARRSYEFWQIRSQADGWLTAWGVIQNLDGSGWQSGASSTATGASRLGGVVRVAEIASGKISHALVMSSDSSCAGTFRAPAVKTDGEHQGPDCTPQGARLQLDPTLDLASLPGLNAAERAVAHALQAYGIYVIDKGGAPMSISFELAHDASSPQQLGAVYMSAGMTWDYYDLPHIPWSRLRVLRRWDGS